MSNSVYALALLTALAVPRSLAPPETGRIQGHVRDGTGRPIARAQVLVVGTALAGMADDSGRYVFPMVAPGIYTVRARRIGYQSADSTGVRVQSAQTQT